MGLVSHFHERDQTLGWRWLHRKYQRELLETLSCISSMTFSFPRWEVPNPKVETLLNTF